MPDFQNPDGSAFNEAGGIPANVFKPSSGDTITMAWNQRVVYIANSAKLNALTIKLPMRALNGERVEIAAQNTIVSLTVQDGFGNAITGVPVQALQPGAALQLRRVNNIQFGPGATIGLWVPWSVTGSDADLGAVVNTNAATSSATVTAAQISGGPYVVLQMTGVLSAVGALTLPTVANLVAALPVAATGQNYVLRIMNQSTGNFDWTVTTNTGWTLSGNMNIPAGSYMDYQVQLTSLTAATLTAIDSLAMTPVASAYAANNATTAQTVTAAQLASGSAMNVLNMTGTLGGALALTLPTVAALVAAVPHVAGQSWTFRVINTSGAAFAWTLTTASGWTLTGTQSVAQNTWRDFVVTVNAAGTAGTVQSVGVGTQS